MRVCRPDVSKKKNITKGIYYLLIGLLKWPFRYDWIRKLIIKPNWI